MKANFFFRDAGEQSWPRDFNVHAEFAEQQEMISEGSSIYVSCSLGESVGEAEKEDCD